MGVGLLLGYFYCGTRERKPTRKLRNTGSLESISSVTVARWSALLYDTHRVIELFLRATKKKRERGEKITFKSKKFGMELGGKRISVVVESCHARWLFHFSWPSHHDLLAREFCCSCYCWLPSWRLKSGVRGRTALDQRMSCFDLISMSSPLPPRHESKNWQMHTHTEEGKTLMHNL